MRQRDVLGGLWLAQLAGQGEHFREGWPERMLTTSTDDSELRKILQVEELK